MSDASEDPAAVRRARRAEQQRQRRQRQREARATDGPAPADAVKRSRLAEQQRIRRQRQREVGAPAYHRILEAQRLKRQAASEEEKQRRREADAAAKKRRRENEAYRRAEAEKKRQKRLELRKSFRRKSKRGRSPALTQAKGALAATGESSCSAKMSKVARPRPETPCAVDSAATQIQGSKLCKRHPSVAVASTETTRSASGVSSQMQVRDKATQTAGILHGKGTQTQCLQLTAQDLLSASFYAGSMVMGTLENKAPCLFLGAEGSSHSLQRLHFPSIELEDAPAVDDIAVQNKSPNSYKMCGSVEITSTGTSTCSAMSSITTQTDVTDKGTQMATVLFGKGTQTSCLPLKSPDA